MAVQEGVFPQFKLAMAKGQVNWETADVRAVLVNENVDAPDLATELYLSAVSSLARSAPVTVTGKAAAVDGLYCELDHNPIVFSAVPAIADDGYDGLLYYIYNADEAAALMVAYGRKVAAGGSITNLPVMPNGGSITFTPDDFMIRI